jgi:hypothetical protein
MALIEQNWRLIAVPNTTALALTALGLIGPVAATVISNGAAIVAGANALRPLFDRSPPAELAPLPVGFARDEGASDRPPEEGVEDAPPPVRDAVDSVPQTVSS